MWGGKNNLRALGEGKSTGIEAGFSTKRKAETANTGWAEKKKKAQPGWPWRPCRREEAGRKDPTKPGPGGCLKKKKTPDGWGKLRTRRLWGDVVIQGTITEKNTGQ